MFEDGDGVADVATRTDAIASTQSSHDVAHQVAIEIGSDHHIKLLWFADELHACVVYDHLLVFDLREFLSDCSAGLEEAHVK